MPRIKYQNRGTNNTKAFSDRNPIRPVKVYSGGICFWLIAVGFVSRIFYNISAPRPLVFANLVFALFARPKADRTTNEANGGKSTKASNDQRTKKKRKKSQFTRQITRDHSSSFDRDERSQMEFLTRLTRARLLHISRPRADCRSAIREFHTRFEMLITGSPSTVIITETRRTRRFANVSQFCERAREHRS